MAEVQSFKSFDFEGFQKSVLWKAACTFDFFDFILEKPCFPEVWFFWKEIFARWFKFLVGGSCFVRNNWLDRNKTMAMEAEPDQTYEQPVVTAEPEIGAR